VTTATSEHLSSPTSPADDPEPPVRTIPALDGIRAIGIVLVVLFHGGVTWLGGGFFGVDVFFVLSGFLITGLLVAEFDRSRTIHLARFWGHRVRRLLPALLVMLVAVGAYALLFAASDSLGEIRGDAIATLLYVNNWHLLLDSQGYFAGLSAPRPLLHTWSLSIEEQFYLVWPLVVLATLKLTRSRLALGVVAIAGAIASAVAMALLFDGGTGLDRVYYGTDTRAQAVLIGAALAICLASPLRRRRSHPAATALVRPLELGSAARTGIVVLGWLGLLGIIALVTTSNASTTWIYTGGFALVSLAAAGLIASVSLVGTSHLARLLSLRPVRYVGAISYGLYLWHWPVFVFLTPDRTHLSGIVLLGVRIGVAVAIAAASYHFLEMPIRRGALRGWRGWLAGPVAIGTAVVVLLVSTAGGTASISQVAGRLTKSLESTAINNPGTGANTPTVTAGTAGPVRLLLVGSSEASFLAFGLGPASGAHDIDFAGDGVLGCGFLHGETILHGTIEPGISGERGGKLVPCATQEVRWRADVDAFHPDVVMVANGAYEVRDRLLDGRWTHIGEPAFDIAERAAIERDVAILGSTGAVVVLLTAPYYHQPEQADGQPWPEDQPARVNAYNAMIRSIAAEHPGRVVVLDLNRALDPAGHYTSTLDGKVVRFSDGIHVNPVGAALVAPWLLDAAHRIGVANRAAS
jgi:peptidoglycan/LPS O-acetylase OafA/YrhL